MHDRVVAVDHLVDEGGVADVALDEAVTREISDRRQVSQVAGVRKLIQHSYFDTCRIR